MASYHFSCNIIRRSRNQSAVRRAAYISGTRLQRTVQNGRPDIENFSRKSGEVKYSNIFLPMGIPPIDREELWNLVEKSEKRVDAQYAREVVIALPKELNLEQQKRLLEEFIQSTFCYDGMIVDSSIHYPSETSTSPTKNPHAHLLITMRRMNIDHTFHNMKETEWNKKDLLFTWRRAWADICNQHLRDAGFKFTVTAEANLFRLPTLHMGHKRRQAANADMTEIYKTANSKIKEVNEMFKSPTTMHGPKFTREDKFAKLNELAEYVLLKLNMTKKGAALLKRIQKMLGRLPEAGVQNQDAAASQVTVNSKS